MVYLPVIINPNGKRRTVKIAEAIMLIDERSENPMWYAAGYYHKPRTKEQKRKVQQKAWAKSNEKRKRERHLKREQPETIV